MGKTCSDCPVVYKDDLSGLTHFSTFLVSIVKAWFWLKIDISLNTFDPNISVTDSLGLFILHLL